MSTAAEGDWYSLENHAEIDSPALLIYPDRVDENLARMIHQAGDVSRLRPHVKTHKLAPIVESHLARGINRFKVATVAEAEMCAEAGARDILLGYPPVGPRAARFAALIPRFPGCRWSATVDSPQAADDLSSAVKAHRGAQVDVLLDLDCGQHRTGIAVGDAAFQLYGRLGGRPGLRPGGLHVYDGHLHDSDPAVRAARCDAAFAPVQAFRERLTAAGFEVPRVVAGGTPTFPMHARRGDVECSPGTCVLWDAGYAGKLADLDYLHAAVLLMRVISKPLPDRLCLDLGHKAVASEMPHPRVVFLNLPEARVAGHNEEHLIVDSTFSDSFHVGDVIYGIPWHVCPTVALHSEVIVVRAGRAVDRWRVAARDRRITG